MKPILFSLLLIIAYSTQAQTFVGSLNENLTPVQLSSSEYGYYYFSNDSLYITDSSLNLVSSNPIPSLINSTPLPLFVSRFLFDSDNGIEFVCLYNDSVTWNSTVRVINNNVANTLPNLFASSNYNVEIRNQTINSQLIVSGFDRTTNRSSTAVYDLIGQALLIKEIPIEQQSLYPNPSVEMVKLPSSPGETIYIYDTNGRLIDRKISNTARFILKVNNYSRGNYLVRTSTGASYKFTKR